MPTIYNKRGLSNALNAVNPVLGSGEIVYVMDTNTLVVGNGSGVFSSLSGINATPLTHSHTVSDITNFNTSVSGLLPTIANSGDNRILTSTGSSVGINAESNLTFDGTLLNVSGSGTFASGVNISNQTGSTIASFDANKNVISLTTSTYPSLTELSYVKGVTSALQTQIDSKSSTSHTHGNITNAGAIGSTANLPLITTTSGAITTGSFGSTANTFCQGNDSRLSDSRAPTGGAGGDLTGTYPNPTLTTTGVTGGTYRSVTVDTKGRITAGTNPTTLAGYGITDVGNGTLTLNVSGTGLSGSASFTANQSGNTTFTVTSNATSANTGSTIVARDASGNFSAGTITATLSGNASTATNSTQLGGVAASNYFRVDGSYANADMNVPVEGYWHVAPNAANLPDGALYGHRWDYDHAGDGNWVAQFYTPTSGDAGMWFRQRRGGTWQTWRKLIDSTTYNSYSPTLTGGGASGTWGINVTGTAASETLATVTGRGASTSTNITTTGAMFASNWYRSYGATGWFNETYAGGIWMSDSTYVRVYNNKIFYADNYIWSAASVRAPIFYDSNDTNFYCDPNGTSRFAALIITGSDLYVGDGVTSSIIRMRDSDEGERQLHCNSNRIGFLNQSGGWGSWCEDDGSWATDFAVYAPIFYDRNNTAYYLDPASTSVLNRVNPVGWDTSGRNYSREWIELPNFTGLLSGNNGAYFYPNNASYGAWRIAGTRNGWAGLEFDSTGAGNVSLMMNSGHTGVHNNTYGWQWYWTGGKFYVSATANGGGTMYPVVTSKIIGAALFGFESGTFYLDTYTGAVTSVSRVSQGVYQISYAAGTTAYFNVATSTILHSTYAFTTARVTTYNAAHTVADARYITLLMFDSL